MHPHNGWNWWHITGHLLNCFPNCSLFDIKQLHCCFCILQPSKQLCSIRNHLPPLKVSITPSTIALSGGLAPCKYCIYIVKLILNLKNFFCVISTIKLNQVNRTISTNIHTKKSINQRTLLNPVTGIQLGKD